MKHDRNSQLRVKCPERKKKKKIAQEDRQFLSAESLKEEGVTGTGGRDRYQQLHFLSFKRPALVECPQAAAQCPRSMAQTSKVTSNKLHLA